MPRNVWLVYQPVDFTTVEFYGLFRRKADAQATRETEQENLRASGNQWESVQIEALEAWPPRRIVLAKRRGRQA